MNCKICSAESMPFYQGRLLSKYNVTYYRCVDCEFIQTEEPFWLKEAYENIITQLDIGLVSRNLYLKEKLPVIIDGLFPEAKNMLDYGGGYGMLVRLMRDQGYNFYRQDIYCQNLFAQHFDIADAGIKRFDLLTAFEVFEHLSDPLTEISQMFELSDTIIFSTEIVPEDVDFSSWWYVSPSTGQHIAFYSVISLGKLAAHFGKYFYTNGKNMHILSKSQLDGVVAEKVLADAKPAIITRIQNIIAGKKPSRPSLLEPDYQFIESLLKSNNHSG